MVIDPAVKKPELKAFNHLVGISSLPLTYHLPALYGTESMDADVHGVKGIIIFGSASSVYDRLPWQIALESYLKKHFEKKTPMVGICYGHQMLAYMLGGKVEYHHPHKETLRGLREVRLSPNPLWNGGALTGELAYSHNEIVSQCPPEMQPVGKSDRFELEALAHKTLPIWTFQAHPEAVPGQFVDTTMTRLEFGHSLLKRFCDYVKDRK